MKIGQILSVKTACIIGAISALTLGTALFMLTSAPATHADSDHLTLDQAVGKVFCILDVGADLATPYTGGYDCDKDGSTDDMRFVVTKTPGPDGETTLVMAMDAWSKSAWTTITDSNTDPDAISTENNNFFAALPTDLSTTISKTATFPSQTWAFNSLSIDGNDITEAPTSITATDNAAPISYVEWMGSAKMYNTTPHPDSVGDLFCKALTGGASCYGTSSFYDQYSPVWTRTTRGSTGQAWTINGYNSDTMISDFTNEPFTILPVLAATADLELCDKTPGTFAEPYFIAPDCPEAPSLTLHGLSDNPWLDGTLNVTGTVTDPSFTTGFTKYYAVTNSASTPAPSDSSWAQFSITDSGFTVNLNFAHDPDHTQYYLHYKIINPLGVITTGYYPFRVDAIGPEIIVTPSGDYDLPDPVTPLITASDDRTGLAALCYSWDEYFDLTDCDDPGLTIIASGTVLDTSPLDYNSTHTLYVYAFDRVGNRTIVSETYHIAKHAPTIDSISPTSGPTTGGTDLTISGDFFGSNPLTGDDWVIKSYINTADLINPSLRTFQLTEAGKIIIADDHGNYSFLDTSSVSGNIIDLVNPGLPSPFNFYYIYTDTGNFYLLDAEDYPHPTIIPTPIVNAQSAKFSFAGIDAWAADTGGRMILTVNGSDSRYTFNFTYDSQTDQVSVTPDLVYTSTPDCSLTTVVAGLSICSNNAAIWNLLTDEVVNMPGNVSIRNMFPIDKSFFDSDGIIAQIIGEDNKIYIVFQSGTGTAISLLDDSASLSQVSGNITSINCVLYGGYCAIVDDLGKAYTLDYGILSEIDTSNVTGGVAEAPFLAFFLILRSPDGDYYSVNSTSDPAIYVTSETKPSTVSLGDTDCPITSWTNTEITCSTPAHTRGLVDLTVDTGGLTGTKQKAFLYIGDNPIFQPTLTDPTTGITVHHLGEGFAEDLYLSVTEIDKDSRHLGDYNSFARLGIYDINICSHLDQSCVPLHTWTEGLQISIPLNDTSFDTYHLLYLPTPDLANLVTSRIENGLLIFDSTHLSEYAIVAGHLPKVPDTGWNLLGMSSKATGNLLASLFSAAALALTLHLRKKLR